MGAGIARQPQAPKPGEQATIRVEVDVVSLLVTVKDRKGRLVNTLNKGDFEIFEDGKKQDIRYFARETALPLTIGLLIDTSISQGNLIQAEREAAEVFFRRVLGEKDMAFVISFGTDVDLLQDFTNNLTLLRRSLEGLRVSSGGSSPTPTVRGPFPVTPRGTRLYDAVYLAAREKLATEVGRKAIVMITDGEDQGSQVKPQEAIEAAHKADLIIYAILYYDYNFYYANRAGYSGEGQMKKLGEETGGRMIRIDRGKDLPQAFEEISQELRSQYSLGYTPTNRTRDGGFRKLRIQTIHDAFRVQARKGYYALGKTEGN